MVSHHHFRLLTLGRLALLTPAGEEDESLGKQRRRLALLAVLALRRRPLPREALAEMFWGDQDEARARHSLDNALSHVRRTLGAEALARRQADVALAAEAPLAVDAVELAEAAAAGDHARAAALYGGPFLDGVHIEGSVRFERWAEGERRRLDALFLEACQKGCHALARGRRWDECAALAARWLEAAPLSADAALYLMNALKAPGTREASLAALAEYERLRARLEREYELAPDKSVAALAADIAKQLEERAPAAAADAALAPVTTERLAAQGAAGASAQSGVEAAAATGSGPPPATPASSSGAAALWRRSGAYVRVRLTRLAWAAAVAAVAVTVAAVAALRGSSRSPNGSRRTPPKPMIAVADIRVVNADTAAAWLAYGLPQMITAKLSRIPEVDVVAPSQVRELRATAGAPPRPLSAAEAVQLGRRLGATLVVTGGVLHTDTATMLDLSTYDVATGRLVRVEAVTGTNVVLIAEEVAVRLLALVGASGPGPRLEEVETRSVEAYRHFIRHAQLGSEGRTEEAVRELDAAIALDSSFISAVHTRAVLAFHRNETEVLARLNAVFERHRARATEFDRLERESFLAEHRGDHARAEGMAELLVRRYPRDPRGYGRLIDVYGRLGRWADAERLAERLLALDSLGAARARGPCTACFGYGSLMGYGSLIGARLFQGKWAEAERAARRLVALQPDVPGAYANLAWVLAFRQRYDEALAAQRRALALEGRDASIDYGRLLLMARHLDKVDSLVAAWLASGRRPLREQALDLRAMLERERGQFRAAIATLDSLAREFPAGGVLLILRAHTIARLGDYDRAERLFEELTHGKPDIPAASRTGGAARVYAWHHALLADAVAPARDTVWLRALADSIEMVGRRSYYPRDWRVHHHVRGLLAMKAGRYEEAIREFEAARYGAVNMWTRSLAEAGRAAMLLGRPEDAIAFLRDAYRAVPDAMGRYQPRSELDYLMALAFRQAHMPDSAAVYATYARRAWTAPDPEVRRLVAQLP